MRVLVTGGAGFIGSHVVEELLRRNHKVLVVDDMSGGRPENIAAGAEIAVEDVSDYEAMEWWFRGFGPEVVYHLAAYAAEGLSPFIRSHNAKVNGLGSANILSLALQYEVLHYHFTSSMAVYGSQAVPFEEWNPKMPEDPYGIYKAAAEDDILAAHETHGLQYTIWRPHNVYGPRQNIWDPYRNVIGIFIKQALAKQPLTIFGDGSQVRAFSHISEVALPMVEALGQDWAMNRTFNIGGDVPYTVKDLAGVVNELADGVGVVHLPVRDEVHEAYCSHDELDRAIPAPVSRVGIGTGLEEMILWAKQAQPYKSKLPEIELERGLPPSWRALGAR